MVDPPETGPDGSRVGLTNAAVVDPSAAGDGSATGVAVATARGALCSRAGSRPSSPCAKPLRTAMAGVPPVRSERSGRSLERAGSGSEHATPKISNSMIATSRLAKFRIAVSSLSPELIDCPDQSITAM